MIGERERGIIDVIVQEAQTEKVALLPTKFAYDSFSSLLGRTRQPQIHSLWHSL